jgi:two-component system, chemotaxis family, chemotaxis protein CheY
MKQNPKTLIVEDSEAISSMMEFMLNDLGINDISIAPDGMRALELFKNAFLGGAPYSLVFLDLMMPVMDGQSTLKIMRAVEKQGGISGEEAAVIIMSSSCDSPKDMMDAIYGECTDYIVKPISAVSLHSTLSKHKLI